MNTGRTRGYVLTFRCIKCGKYEVFAHYATERIVFARARNAHHRDP